MRLESSLLHKMGYVEEVKCIVNGYTLSTLSYYYQPVTDRKRNETETEVGFRFQAMKRSSVPV